MTLNFSFFHILKLTKKNLNIRILKINMAQTNLHSQKHKKWCLQKFFFISVWFICGGTVDIIAEQLIIMLLTLLRNFQDDTKIKTNILQFESSSFVRDSKIYYMMIFVKRQFPSSSYVKQNERIIAWLLAWALDFIKLFAVLST